MKRIIYNIYYYFLFKFKNPKKVKLHPRFDKPIKFGFRVGNRYFFRLAHDYDMYENRFRYLKTFYTEVQNKLTSADINEFCEASRNHINNYIKAIHEQKEIDPRELSRAIGLLDEMEHRSTWYFEPTSLYKYASVVYFDLSEDIRDYDVIYSNKKIEHWSKKKTLFRLILKELMEGVENLLTLSSNDFNYYISQIQEKKDKQQNLISEAGLIDNKKSIEITM